MSAPEPLRPLPELDETFTEVLRGATFVSTEGRAFRLFAEETPSDTIPSTDDVCATECEANSDLLYFPAPCSPPPAPSQLNGPFYLPIYWPEHLARLEKTAVAQIHSLADHLERRQRNGEKTFSFNSLYIGEGCTTLALCASRELADRGFHVLLADSHQQNPELPELLRLPINPDLYEILTLIPDRLDLLPWTETFLCFDSMGREKTFDELVARLRSEYDFILLDDGSLFESPVVERAPIWRRMSTDGILLVRNPGQSSLESIRAVVECLRKHEIELLGIAENKIQRAGDAASA